MIQLYDWQQRIVDIALKHNDYGMFLDCGLGKTPTALAFASQAKSDKVIVITLAPKAMEDETVNGSWDSWSRIAGFTPTHRYKGSSAKVRDEWLTNMANKSCYITNYESLYSKGKIEEGLSAFIQNSYGECITLILDESHKVKDTSTSTWKNTKHIQSILKSKCRCRTILLSGTPFTQGYIDFRGQMSFWGDFISKKDFQDLYCIMEYVPYMPFPKVKGYKNTNHLLDRVHKHAITMQSCDVVKLPEQIFNYHTVDNKYEMSLMTRLRVSQDEFNKENTRRELLNLPTSQLTDQWFFVKDTTVPYSSSITNNTIVNPWRKNFSYPEDKWVADSASNLYLRCRELSSGFLGNKEEYRYYSSTRMQCVKKILQKLLDASDEGEDANTVLFYNFVPEFEMLYEMIKLMRSPKGNAWDIDIFNGETKAMGFYNRRAILPVPQKEIHNHQIILSNFASGSTGMNWQEYHHCIVYSLPVYRDWAQGLKRLHRIGQSRPVIYDVLIGNNFLDKGMMEALNNNTDYNEKLFEASWNKEASNDA